MKEYELLGYAISDWKHIESVLGKHSRYDSPEASYESFGQDTAGLAPSRRWEEQEVQERSWEIRHS